MSILFVVDRTSHWPFEIPGSSVASARAYLTEPAYANHLRARVVNLCRVNRYQGRGYYVSLLAEARGHEPLPSVKALGDLQSDELRQAIADKVAELTRGIQHEESDRFELDAYFGRDPSGAHGPLAQQLFDASQAPLLRAQFRRSDDGWQLEKLTPISADDVQTRHREFLLSAATEFVTGDNRAPAATGGSRRTPVLAILHDPAAEDKCSNEGALRKFVEIAPRVGIEARLIEPGDVDRIEEFDALFIRADPSVDNYTYPLARKCESLGMPVIDDPESVLRCSNKVYLDELLTQHGIPKPKTLKVHKGNVGELIPALGLPLVLKVPDGAFGLGVVKIESEEDLQKHAKELFARSELLVAQEWLPTEFDWRIGVFDGRPLFAAQYMMAPGHWQVHKREDGQHTEGDTIAFSIGEVPEVVVETALRACNLIGRGLYGVDLKQSGEKCWLIEVNVNPNIDAGNEDQILGDAIYREILGVFARRMRAKRKTAAPGYGRTAYTRNPEATLSETNDERLAAAASGSSKGTRSSL
ncbi:RimK family protein [Ramlibacter sp. PS4R-6]|uniref:RimK family protein n=1 Tax=Ramlibacter sp. PS4R-6 TaxID=3133438 RepID=UPI00309F7D30